MNDVALEYVLFDGAPFDFPPALLPVMPPFRLAALRWGADTRRATPAWAAGGRHYGRARYALRDAYRMSGVGPAGALLAPAYHCRTMLDPALALGAPVRLYAVDESLRPDLGDIARQLERTDQPVKAVLVTHYFGFAYDLRELAALCRARDVALVEDCAQSMPLATPSNGMGVTGRWCVASPWKFFPCEDGGVLWSGTGQTLDLPPLRAPGTRGELAQLRRMGERARLHLPRDGRGLAAVAERAGDPREQVAQAVSRRLEGPSQEYQRERESISCAVVSRWIVAHSDIAEVVAVRRANYERWARAASDLPSARAPWPVLGPNDTPYMFPLLIEHPERHFAPLKRAGLPIFRWDSMAASACTTAARYRLGLLHLPCHQALTDEELEWMIRTVGGVLGG